MVLLAFQRQVDSKTGALLKDKAAEILLAIENLTATDNGSKMLLMNFWPGPIVGIADGWPSFAPGDPVNTQPTGTVGAPRGPLHGGRSTRAAPRGGRRSFLY